MIRKIIVLALVATISQHLFAQKGFSAFNVSGYYGFAVSDDHTGFGLGIKELLGINKTARLTISGGYAHFHAGNRNEINEEWLHLLSIQLGFQQTLKKFYIEPKLGVAELGGKIYIGGDYARPSTIALHSTIETGYMLKKFNFFVALQNARGISKGVAGTWKTKSFTSVNAGIGISF